MKDVHNIVFERLTRLSTEGLTLESLIEQESLTEVDPDTQCQYCERPIGAQPAEFGSYSYPYTSYGSTKDLCICCGSYFFNNPTVMGIENPKRPTTGHKFGMMAGCAAFIDIEGGRTYVFMPKKTMDKFPKETLQLGKEKYGITFIESTRLIDQLSIIAELSLNTPSVWISNFGRITNQLIANLAISPSFKNMYEANSNDLNSGNFINQVYDVDALLKIAKILSETSGVTNFVKLMYDSWNGRISPAKLVEELKKEKLKNFIPVVKLLPADPHQAQTYLSKAKDLKL